jgi:NADH-quinone oxidoreductase subunit A
MPKYRLLSRKIQATPYSLAIPFRILVILTKCLSEGDGLDKGMLMNPVDLSNSISPWDPGPFSFAVYSALVLGLIVVLLFLAAWVGEKRRNPEKARPFESGVIPTGAARRPYPIPFYLIATFFLVFDVEAIFIYSWAVAFDHLGWAGWLQISFFILVLLVSLIYLWKKGGFEWGHPAKE